VEREIDLVFEPMLRLFKINKQKPIIVEQCSLCKQTARYFRY